MLDKVGVTPVTIVAGVCAEIKEHDLAIELTFEDKEGNSAKKLFFLNETIISGGHFKGKMNVEATLENMKSFLGDKFNVNMSDQDILLNIGELIPGCSASADMRMEKSENGETEYLACAFLNSARRQADKQSILSRFSGMMGNSSSAAEDI